MLTQEPDLKLIGAEHLTHNQIVGAIVAEVSSTPTQCPGIANNNLVGINQSRQLNGDLLAATRRPFDLCSLSHVGSHGQAYAAEEVNPLGNRVNQVNLFAIMFVVKQMQLIKGRTRHLQ